MGKCVNNISPQQRMTTLESRINSQIEARALAQAPDLHTNPNLWC